MKLGHVAVHTKDMDKSIEFYTLLGAKKGAESINDLGDGVMEHLIHMEFDGEATLELICLSDPSRTPEGIGVCEHLCFDVENIDETVKELRAKGIDTFDAEEPYSLPILGGIRIIFLTGPGGESIELLQRFNAGRK